MFYLIFIKNAYKKAMLSKSMFRIQYVKYTFKTCAQCMFHFSL